MYLKTLLLTSLSLTTINPLISHFNTMNNKSIKATTNTVSEIAKKYQSPTIDPSTINFENFLNDIKNSAINNVLNKAINTSFQISKTDTFSCYVWYNGDSGSDMARNYNNSIKNKSINALSYLSMLTLISNVAHYYGDNTTMSPYVRQSAISNTIGIIMAMANSVKANVNVDLNLNKGIFSQLNNWSTNYYQIVNDALARNYDKDPLLSQYNNINYDGLNTYNGNLHAADDDIDSIKHDKYWLNRTGWHAVEDYFYLGNDSNNHLFKISFVNNYNFWLQYIVVGNLWEFSYSESTAYAIEMN